MAFDPGAHVHVAHFGKGVVREVRNGRRYVVELKGTSMVVGESQLSAIDAPKRPARTPAPASGDVPALVNAPSSIDLHGRTMAEAEAEVDAFINDAILAGFDEVRIVHGRSGGRVKAAVHGRLAKLPSVRGFRVDPRNDGVTIVSL